VSGKFCQCEVLKAQLEALKVDNKLLLEQVIPRDPTEAQKHAIKCQNSMNIWRQRAEKAEAKLAAAKEVKRNLNGHRNANRLNIKVLEGDLRIKERETETLLERCDIYVGIIAEKDARIAILERMLHEIEEAHREARP